MVFTQLSTCYTELTSLSRINGLHISEFLALQTLASLAMSLLPLQGHGQASSDIQVHNFYNTLL